MTEAEFIPLCLDKLWRADDKELEAEMPNLLREVNAKIDVDINLTPELTNAEYSIVDGYVQGADWKRVKSVLDYNRGPLYYVPPDIMFSKNPDPRGYTIINNKIFVGLADGLNTGATALVSYYSPIAPFFDTLSGSADGFESRHPHFYMLAAQAHISLTWMRDQEYAAQLNASYQSDLESVRAYENYRYYGAGGSLQMTLPGIVA